MGARFAFARFWNVRDKVELEKALNGISLKGRYISANVSKYDMKAWNAGASGGSRIPIKRERFINKR
ncbi:hypothetical protein HanRHA438_Chr13g0600861 [Helianthus annuus]|nr:hypothetical protein HanRHA438_Chr13g0600861 [Helianthus annuus]